MYHPVNKLGVGAAKKSISIVVVVHSPGPKERVKFRKMAIYGADKKPDDRGTNFLDAAPLGGIMSNHGDLAKIQTLKVEILKDEICIKLKVGSNF